MRSFTGKTMFVLGAGASYHTGAPLLRDFLSEARARMMKAKLFYEDDFNAVFDWIEKMRGPAYYLNLDLNNLEHVFSLISMLKAVGLKKGAKLYKSISLVMLETLEQCQVAFRDGIFYPDPTYSTFLTFLDEHNNQNPGISARIGLDTIVTFNYDVLLDFAIYDKDKELPNYCLQGENPHHYKLLKLHGSMNWATHDRCPKNRKKEIQIVDPNPLVKNYPHIAGPGGFRMFTHVLQKTPCRFCDQENVLYPLFIPPTWTKDAGKIRNVWKTAIDELRTTSPIVIIGYSLPPTDTFFQYILALGLFEGAQLERIIVIDPAASKNKDFKERYEKAFSRGLVERGKLKFRDATFRELVSRSRDKSGGSKKPLMPDVVYDLEYNDWD